MATNMVKRNSVYSAFLVSVILIYYVSVFSTCHAYNLTADDPGWRYYGIYGMKNWSDVYPDCYAANHTRQSPIDIVRAETEENTNLTQIDLIIAEINGSLTMVNNGHTVTLDFAQISIHISGGGLPGKFRVAGVHFHWGENDTEGSEHTVDGKPFPVEMHVVIFDTSIYSEVHQAAKGVNSVAVISVLFQVSTDNNSALDPVVSHLQNLTIPGQAITIPYFYLPALFPLNKRYYRYLGSLTTPPCAESVIWNVFEDHVNISSSQLAKFRMLQGYIESGGKIRHLEDNRRTTQPLDGRIVQRSGNGSSFNTEPDGKNEHLEDNRRTTQPLDGRITQPSGIDSSFNVLSQIALIVTMGVVLQLFV